MPDDSRLKRGDSSTGSDTLIADSDAASIKADAAKRGYLRETFRVFRKGCTAESIVIGDGLEILQTTLVGQSLPADIY